MASATGRNWWGVVPTGQLDSSGDNMADGSASYMQVGIDWFYEDVSGTQFTVAPHIYRWDRYDTNNSGGYFYEVLNPDPNNGNTAKTFGPLYWGSGSGTREIDSFGTRTYTKQINPFTVTYRMSWYNSGSAYSGYYHGVSDGYHDWTITIPGKVVGKVLTINPNGGVLKGDNFGSSEGTTQNATVILTTNRSYYSWLGTATKTGCIFNGWYTATNGGVQVFNAQGQALKGTYWSESAIETWAETRYIYDGDLTIYAQWTPTVTVSISGTPTVGNTLTASVATSSTGTKSYQWYYTSTANAASGTNISGATSSTYKVTSAVVGYYIGCKVTTAAVTGYRTSSGIKTTSAKATKANDLVRTFTLASGLTYDGSPKALVTAFTTASGSGKLGLGASSTSAPSTWYSNRSEVTGTAAGLYYVWCKTEGNASYNAMAATYKGSVTIKKATPTVTVTTYTSNQYAGSAVNLATATSSNCTYTLGYSKTSSTDSSTVTWLSANTPITSATSGIAKDTTYYIWYKATGATNYENIAATYKGTAKYTYKTYTISFNANGHGTAPSSLTKTYGTNLILPSKIADSSTTEDEFTLTFIASGENSNPGDFTSTKTITYVQQSWNTAADGSGTSYNLSGNYTVNSATTLYAIWSSSSISNPVTMPSAITKSDSTDTNIAITKYIRFYNESSLITSKTIRADKITSYAFGGWGLRAGGQILGVIRANSQYTVWANLFYFSVFSVSNVYTKFYSIEDIEHPTKEGYVFDGWYTASEGGTKIDFPYTPTSADDINVYAHWRNKNKIFFYDSAGARRYANTYFYDENGIKHNITVSFFGSNGTGHNLKSVLSYNDNVTGE